MHENRHFNAHEWNDAMSEPDSDDQLRPSRAEQKREAEAAQTLGEQLIALPDEELEALDLPERLLDAIRLAKRLPQRGAQRRQRQYIGKLMRDIDPEPIQAALRQRELARNEETLRLHRAENWRERLIAEGDTAQSEFLTEYPGTDRQQLRQAVRDAQNERRQGRGPQKARALFRLIRDQIATA